ncbi:hypothetical protein B0O99DRAFT_647040 [Bisporella sp. PMI_857]|nr:hypothetical protein B0O99DRAFT_647040 [Bisporella sp. PMI_857]
MHEHTGSANALAARTKVSRSSSDEDGINYVPTWAGRCGANYASWQFTASSTDLKAQAANNCSSCWILLNRIVRLNDASPPQLKIENGLDFAAVVTFCSGNVLRADVHRIEETETDSLFGTTDGPGETLTNQPIMCCEFYTLPDTIFCISFMPFTIVVRD